MKTLITIILVLILFNGCSSKGYWLIPSNLTQSDFNRDNYSCNYQAQALAYGSGFQHQEFGIFTVRRIRNRTYWDCMTSKGYTWVKE
jgi:hypothetical protein